MKKKWVLIAIVLVAIAGILSYSVINNEAVAPPITPVIIASPGEVAVNFHVLLFMERNYAAAEQLLLPEEKAKFDADGGLQKINETSLLDPDIARIKFSVALVSEELLSEFEAKVKIALTEDLDGNTLTNIFSMQLEKFGGRWLLHNFKFSE
ncbi:MAG: hypothetical protein ABH841_02705 [Candidatus Nealsonbacteria bacterium]